MTIQRTVLATNPLIRNTLLIVPLLLVVLLYFLREGITVESLKIGSFHVEGLYLKLDKKLVAKVHDLSIPFRGKKLDSDQIETQLDRLKKVPQFFQYIALDDVEMGDEHYRFIYRNNVLYLRNNAYEVAGTIERKGDEIVGNIPYLSIPKYHLLLKGTLRYNYRNGHASAKGSYRYQEITGSFSAAQAGETIRFVLNSDSFAHTSTLMALPGVNDTVREWADRRLAAKRFQIVLFKGVLHRHGDSYTLDPMALNATFTLEKPVVRFHDKLHRIRAESGKVTVENNVLYVAMTHPTYADKSLEGSRMHVTNLLGNVPSNIHIELHAKTGLDDTMIETLKVYGITLPLRQKSGSATSEVTLDIATKSGQTNYKGHTRLGRGQYIVFDTPMTIDGGEVVYDAHRVTLQRVDANLGWVHAVLSGSLDLDAQKAKLRADIKRLVIGRKGDPLLQMNTKRNVPLTIRWKQKSLIDLPTFKTRITLGKTGGYTITCRDIDPILPALKGIPPFVKGGKVTVTTADGHRFRFNGSITWPDSYLYNKKGSITHFPFRGTFDGKQTTMTLLNGRITYASKGNRITLSDLYIDGKKLLGQNQTSSGSKTRLHVTGTRSLIRYEKYVLLTDRFDLRINGKNTVFVATKDGDTVRMELNGKAIVIKANQIKAPMLRALIHFGGLKGGRYSLDLHGRINGKMKGVITIKGGTVSSFKTYNNMIALFNTVPALASLSDPGFSKNGFDVRSGRIEFRIVKNRIFFDMIYIDGRSAAISGKGTVSTINGAINMDLAVRTARGIGKFIGSLPIVGYILMGKDKSITTGVKVTGTLEKPKVTTNIVMETLLTPFKMFTRVIQSPAHIINK